MGAAAEEDAAVAVEEGVAEAVVVAAAITTALPQPLYAVTFVPRTITLRVGALVIKPSWKTALGLLKPFLMGGMMTCA